MKNKYRVELQKDYLTFSAAHFITFAGNICERIHGHNYRVRCTIEGQLDENQYVIDFIHLRDSLKKIVDRLDHHVILPTQHSAILVEKTDSPEHGPEVIARFENRRWVFPEEDCVLMPVENTTAELIARCIADELIEAAELADGDFEAMELAVDENQGQWGICRIEFPND